MKLLIVTETASIHAARWVNQLKDTGWEVHVFQALVTGGDVHSEFEFGIFHVPKPCRIPKGLPIQITLTQVPVFMDRLLRLEEKQPGLMQSLHEQSLKDFIRNEKPDLVHSLGLNINWSNICLPVLRVKESLGDEFYSLWLYSSWGTDLSFYAGLSEKNATEVKSVLKNCDYLITEHAHDLNRARQLGFTGKFAGHFTGFGGIDQELEAASSEPTSKRKTILIKGRDIKDGDPVGRASTAMKALKLCRDVLKDYRIVIASISSSGFMQEGIALLAATTDLKVLSLPYMSSEHLNEVYKASRVFISLTVNDGIPRSLLEAMAFGAFPLFGDLESIADLVIHGENGLLAPPEDVEAVADALRTAVTDDILVEKAARTNYEIIRRDFSDKVIRPKVVQMYRDVASAGRGTKGNGQGEKPVTGAKAYPLLALIKLALAGDGAAGFDFIEKVMNKGSGTICGPVVQAMALNNPRVFDLLDRAMSMNDAEVFDLLDRAIELNDAEVFDLLDRAMVVNNPVLFGLLDRAMALRDARFFSLLKLAAGLNNPEVFRLMTNKHGFLPAKALAVFHVLMRRWGIRKDPLMKKEKKRED